MLDLLNVQLFKIYSMKKKLGLLAVVLAMAGSWSPMQAQVKLVVHSVDGSLLEASLGDVKSLAFNESGFDVNSLKNQTLASFTFENLRKIEIVPDLTGVGDVVADAPKLRLSVSRNVLKVNGWAANETAPVYVYGVSGQCLLNEANWNGGEINISNLPSGVYVLKVKNETFKFRK